MVEDVSILAGGSVAPQKIGQGVRAAGRLSKWAGGTNEKRHFLEKKEHLQRETSERK